MDATRVEKRNPFRFIAVRKSRAGRTLTRLHARLSIFEGGGSGMLVNAATAACRALPFKVLMPFLNIGLYPFFS